MFDQFFWFEFFLSFWFLEIFTLCVPYTLFFWGLRSDDDDDDDPTSSPHPPPPSPCPPTPLPPTPPPKKKLN